MTLDAIDAQNTDKYPAVRHGITQSSISTHTYNNHRKTDLQRPGLVTSRHRRSATFASQSAFDLPHVTTDVHAVICGHPFSLESGVALKQPVSGLGLSECDRLVKPHLPGSPPPGSHFVERALNNGETRRSIHCTRPPDIPEPCCRDRPTRAIGLGRPSGMPLS